MPEPTRPPTRPDPADLRRVAAQAQTVAEGFNRVVTAALTIGVVVDSGVFECSATVTSWASWLAARAAQREGP
jgi:hypothetical protein